MKRYLIILLYLILFCPCAALYGQQAGERSGSIVSVGGENYYVHTVLKGETVSSLMRLYGVSAEDLIGNNPHIADGLKADQVLKIPVQAAGTEGLSQRKINRLFDVHIVNKGETLYSISRRYEIPVNTLLEDNEGLDPSLLSIGQQINIRKKSKGDASPQDIERQMSDYVEAINSVTADTVYHLVAQGETLYGLSKQYGITEQSITAANDLSNGLKAGAMIRIPKTVAPTVEQAIAPDSTQTDSLALWPGRRPAEGDVAMDDLSGRSSVNVSLLLPLKNENGEGDRDFLDFYRGVLIAFEDLKSEGVSARVAVYNTSRSRDKVRDIVESPDFTDTDIIIGPVFEEPLAPVLDFAEANGVPVAFPLAEAQQERSSLLYQFRPDPANRYDKIKELIAGNKNIIYVTTTHPDKELDDHVKPLLGGTFRELNYSGSVRSTSFGSMLEGQGDNVIIVSCTSEQMVGDVLAAISSRFYDLTNRGQFQGSLTVVGNSTWATRFANIDRDLYFKVNVCFISGYYADGSNERVSGFDRRYIAEYGSLPSNYSYRGYDVAKLFVGSSVKTGGDFAARLNAGSEKLLQMPYRFVRTTPDGNFTNDQWVMVCYKSDYSIEVK